MGIIAGIHTKYSQDNADKIITQMIKKQAHRDPSTPVTFSNSSFAAGMSNKHDTIYCNHNEIFQWKKNSRVNRNGVYAFVDGIILDLPNLRNLFENEGTSIPIPLCSYIISIAYEKYGLCFMEHLEGEFSCAIWDDNNKRLILARDPYGHKPIHYYKNDDKFVFSSEIKGLLTTKIPREIDMINLSDYLSLNCIPFPGTIFKDIYQVSPGSMLILENDDIKIKKYWTPEMSVDPSITFSDSVVMISEKLKKAVKKRMIGNDIYCFLSGGIDSSAVISCASELSEKKVNAITVGFKEAEQNELEDAKIMASHVGAKLHQIIASPDSFFNMLDTLIFHHDSPFTDTSAYPTYYAAKYASNYTDLILTGDGPDQSIGGSQHHVFAIKNNLFKNKNELTRHIFNLISKISNLFIDEPKPSLLTKITRKLYRDSLTGIRAAYDLRSYFPNIVKKYLCEDNLWKIHMEYDPFRHPEAWFKEAPSTDKINSYLYADMKFYVPDDLMIKVDRMCMANGLETLSPFQDIKLSKIINQLPGNFKIRKENKDEVVTKYILKKCFEKRFPERTKKKGKQGFGIPLDSWLKMDNCKVIKEILLDDRTLSRGFFKKKSIVNLVDTYSSGLGDYYYPCGNAVASLLTFELWNRIYID